MASPRPPLSSIKYLAFEGGGGKGLVYLGAIRALEELTPAPEPEAAQVDENQFEPPLPAGHVEGQAPLITIGQPIAERKLYGLSGASAGAITAFMLAMGMSANSIEAEIDEQAPGGLRQDPWPSRPRPANRLELFFEDPDAYGSRQWSPTSRAKEYENWTLVRGSIRAWMMLPPTNRLLSVVGGRADGVLARRLISVDQGLGTLHPNSHGHPRLADYLYGLLLNRGIFPGFEARKYFGGLFERYLYPKLDLMKVYIEKKPGEMVTFKDFFNMTGVDLVVTGTNVSKNRSAYFSVGYTPDFSVAEAVAISMSIPLLFKPVLIDGDVNRYASPEYNESYRGLWVDGGMLNNYPIHAFDHTARMPGLTFQNRSNTAGGFTVAMPSATEQQFNRSCAGFRLGLRNNAKYEVADDFGEDKLGVLGPYLGSLLLTILADASDSQMKSAEEWARTCMLDPTGLGLVDFAGPSIDVARGKPDRAIPKREAIEKAFQSTMAFWK